jgi:hypothetical protein
MYRLFDLATNKLSFNRNVIFHENAIIFGTKANTSMMNPTTLDVYVFYDLDANLFCCTPSPRSNTHTQCPFSKFTPTNSYFLDTTHKKTFEIYCRSPVSTSFPLVDILLNPSQHGYDFKQTWSSVKRVF